MCCPAMPSWCLIQLLLEILGLGLGRQTPRRVERPHHRQAHDHSRSPKPTFDRESRRLFRNPDQLSTVDLDDNAQTWSATTAKEHNKPQKELRAVLVTGPELMEMLEA
jgi:hypothetical protein